MNPYADEESGNKFEDDNLCDIDLDKDNANSHLALSKEILSSQSFLTTKTSEVGSNGSSPTKTDKSRNNRVSARSMDEIAAQLLEANFFLTALELHTEIVERGKELPRLRDYFSNPANFEHSATVKTNFVVTSQRPSFNSLGDYLGDRSGNLSRTGSYSTLDSLDWSHLSGDNEPSNDRIAVLEFELRKANDTIHKLRKSLTSTSRKRGSKSDSSGPEENENDKRGTITRDTLGSNLENNSTLEGIEIGQELADDSGFQTEDTNVVQFSSLDSKTLNFVVYEYLQTIGCKLTAISLGDELQDQDFEDWDDVGLNTSRPPSLQEIYLKFLEESRHQKKQNISRHHKELQCNLLNEEQKNQILDAAGCSSLKSLNTNGESVSQSSKERENDSISFCNDIESTGKNKSTSLTDEMKSMEDENCELKKRLEELEASNAKLEGLHSEVESLKHELLLIQNQNKQLNTKNVGLENELFDLQANLKRTEMPNSEKLDSTAGKTEFCREKLDESNDNLEMKFSPLFSKRYLVLVKNAIFNTPAVANLDQEHQNILDSVQKGGDLAHISEKCLPNLVANVLLQHRIEAIPLIIETITVHPEQEARMKLLELLFNLVKKPDIRQRHVICQSCLTYARRAGPSRVEAEVLPLCWGQMNEKHVERRVLVAETATALLPYMDVDIASSLVYSILTQLLDDKEDMVVSAALKGLAFLLCLLRTDEKFDSYLKFILKYIKSPFETEQIAVRQYMIPCFAFWTMQQEQDLLQNAVFIVVQYMDNLLKETLSDDTKMFLDSSEAIQSNATKSNQSVPEFMSPFICYCASLESFLPFLFMSVVQSSPFAQKPPPSKEHLLTQAQEQEIFARFPQSVIAAQDVRSMVDDSSHLAYLIHTFDEYLKETTHPEWPQLTWVINELLPRLVQILLQLDVNSVPCVNSMSTVCYSLCRVFGRSFTVAKFVPIFKSKLTFDADAQNFNNAHFVSVLNGSVVPVYAAGVLSTISDDSSDMKEIRDFVSEMLFLYSVNRAPILSLRAATIALLSNSTYHSVLTESIYSAIINASSQLKLTACHLLELFIRPVGDSLLSHRVIPALITLSGDPDTQIRAATMACLGSVLAVSTTQENIDKVSMQLDSLIDDVALQAEAIKTLSRIVNIVNERLRYEFVLRRISSIIEQFSTAHQGSDETEKRKICTLLVQFYSSVCPQGSEYPNEVINISLLPGIRKLKVELVSLGGSTNETIDTLNGFIRDLEIKVGIIPVSGVNNSKSSPASGIGKSEGNIFSKLKGLTK